MRDTTTHKTNEAKYRALFDNSLDAIVLTRPADGAIVEANPAACQLFRYSERELLSKRRDDLLDRADPRFVEAWVERAGAGAVAAELTFARNGGIRFEARASSKLFLDEGGGQVACTSIHDITERQHVDDTLRHSEERFRLLYDNAPLGIMEFDQNGHLTSANRRFAELAGYSQDELIGMTHQAVTLPEDLAERNEATTKLLSEQVDTPVTGERRLLRKDGSTTWVRLTATMTRIRKGTPPGGIAVFEDISERKQAEESLRQSKERFRATLEHAPLGIAECTIDGRFIEANAKLVEILGYTTDEIMRLTVTDVTHPSETEQALITLQTLVSGETDVVNMENRYIRKDRSFVWVHVTASLMSIQGTPPHLILMIGDITARKQTEAELKRVLEASYHQATHDSLTGLVNRAAFQDRLGEALAHAGRDGHLVAIHLLDLDRFKLINDTRGHHIGDLLLKDVAKRIKANIRATDVAARLGGDEFVVVQTHLAEPVGAGVLAKKLKEDLQRKYMLDDQEVHSGVSIGIALYPGDAEGPEQLIKHADLALYEAKHRGRFNYQFYRQELGAAWFEAQRLEQELVRAQRENEFVLHYQPQFDLKTGRLTGIEALLRWCHPTRGTLAATEFIQDAERARLMLSIGQWTLETACRQYREWLDVGLAVPLTLNLSAVQLRAPRLLETLARILDETGVPASMLQLEMRESVLWNPGLSRELLNHIRQSGVRLALDDLGTEMTVLPALDRLPLDAVKPSQGLVRASCSREREATILAAIIGVAHNLRMTVCAGGIETANQLTAMKEQGCDSGQGYLLSAPVETSEMGRLIEMELAH